MWYRTKYKLKITAVLGRVLANKLSLACITSAPLILPLSRLILGNQVDISWTNSQKERMKNTEVELVQIF